MVSTAAPPLDGDEIREAVWERMAARVHPALVRLLGRQAYERCVLLLGFFRRHTHEREEPRRQRQAALLLVQCMKFQRQGGRWGCDLACW